MTRSRARSSAHSGLPNLPHSKNGRTQNNTARAESHSVDGGAACTVRGRPRRLSRAIFSRFHHADARQRRGTYRGVPSRTRRIIAVAVNEIENDGRVHCGHYGRGVGQVPSVKNETLRGADNGGKARIHTHARTRHMGDIYRLRGQTNANTPRTLSVTVLHRASPLRTTRPIFARKISPFSLSRLSPPDISPSTFGSFTSKINRRSLTCESFLRIHTFFSVLFIRNIYHHLKIHLSALTSLKYVLQNI